MSKDGGAGDFHRGRSLRICVPWLHNGQTQRVNPVLVSYVIPWLQHIVVHCSIYWTTVSIVAGPWASTCCLMVTTSSNTLWLYQKQNSDLLTALVDCDQYYASGCPVPQCAMLQCCCTDVVLPRFVIFNCDFQHCSCEVSVPM